MPEKEDNPLLRSSDRQSEASHNNNNNTFIIGISGPSSSGKTTLARLLQNVFSQLGNSQQQQQQHYPQSFILHEDDFYLPDNKIPYTRTRTGKAVQDWDTIDAIDVSFLASSLAYVRSHGSLPPRVKKKEDFSAGDHLGVSGDVIEELRGIVRKRLMQLQQQRLEMDAGMGMFTTLAFLEGFLLYSPPEKEEEEGKNKEKKEKDKQSGIVAMGLEMGGEHVLRPIHRNIHLHLFLPASYDAVKKRREGRSGYVTSGPTGGDANTDTDTNHKNDHDNGFDQSQQQQHNFWVDPPGYVDDIVWPHYVRDHAWLLLPEDDGKSDGKDDDGFDPDVMNDHELVQRVGQGIRMRTDAGVTVPPSQGDLSIEDLLKWAVEEVMKYWETRTRQGAKSG